MNHVLEHLPQLERSLARCRELLCPGGRLFAAFPNPRALTALAYGRCSVVWDPPRHLVLPTTRGLLALLTRVGFVGARAWTSADRAVAYRQASAAHASGRRGAAFAPGRPNLGDRAFGVLERALVLFRVPVGEEILVVARRGDGV
jgi:hypothetical protein